ncbi:hypothetical protein ACWDUN_05270 [Mycobacterium sp. NPDC003323]
MVAPLFQDRVQVDDFSTSGFDLVIGHARDIAATLTLTDYDADGVPAASDLQQLSIALSAVLSAELDGAAAHLGVLNGKILIAALGRAVARTIGRGVLAVDVESHTIALDCVMPSELDATELLEHVCSALTGSTVRSPGQALADLAFRCAGPVSAEAPLEGHALELRAYRDNGLVQLDLWFDTRRFEAYTIEELAEQFPQALVEITSEAVPSVIDAA